MKGNRRFRWRPLLAAVTTCLAVFVLSLQGGPATENTALSSVRTVAPVKTLAARGGDVSAEVDQSPDRPTPAKPAATMDRLRTTDSKRVVEFSDDGVRHVGRVLSSTAVASAGGGGSSRAAGILGLGDPCSCDEDCDGSLGDRCNLVQCIVRGVCTGDNQKRV